MQLQQDMPWGSLVITGGEARATTCLLTVQAPGNFTKGVRWSPDGTCLLTCSDDNVLHVFETPRHLIYPSEPVGADTPPPFPPPDHHPYPRTTQDCAQPHATQ
jgi:WD40 repeat protein